MTTTNVKVSGERPDLAAQFVLNGASWSEASWSR
jgi:hypothetical protein